MDREAWRAAVHGGHKESDTTDGRNWMALDDLEFSSLALTF